jgi:hypothetical protein
VVGIVFVVAPILYFLTKKFNPILFRLTIGCLTLLVITSFLAPQANNPDFGDVRYLAFAIPFFIYLTVITIESLPIRSVYQYLKEAK